MAVYSYAEQFERELQQKYKRELTSYDLEKSNPQVKFINAQTIKLPSITVSGYKDHNRSNIGFNTGTISICFRSNGYRRSKPSFRGSKYSK